MTPLSRSLSWSLLPRAQMLLLVSCLLQSAAVLGAVTKIGSGCTSREGQLRFCVNATMENDVMTYELTSMQTKPADLGWMAIAFGQGMLNSHMVVMWQNEDKSMTVSQRYARWYAEPFVLADPPRNATAIEPKAAVWQPTNSTTFAFQIPAEQALMNGTLGHENLVWALSPMRPGKNYLSHIARHWETGHFKIEYEDTAPPPAPPTAPSERPNPGQKPHTDDKDSSDKASTDEGKSENHSSAGAGGGNVTEEKHPHDHSGHERYVHAHAYLLTAGFLFFLPMGVLAGRWGRVISPVWFKVHWILNLAVAAPIIALGWLMGPISVWQHDGPHFSDPHKIGGVVILVLYVGQVLLGRYIHQRRVESTVVITDHHPPLNIAHVAAGLLFIALAFFQVRTGLDKLRIEEDEAPFARWYNKLLLIWGAILPLLYLVGLVLLPRQWRQERSGSLDAAAQKTYLPLGETSQRDADPASSTRLLFETHEDEEDDDDDDVFERDEKKGAPSRVSERERLTR